MRSIQKTERGTGAVTCQVPVPVPRQGEILVKVLAAALCKSDLDVFYDTESFRVSNVPLPFVMGHEFCGEVLEIGEGVRGFSVGDHISGETHVPCGTCNTCRQGLAHICPDMGLIGRTVNGCFADHMVVPAVSAVKVPKELPPEQAALFEPFGVAVHSVQAAEVEGKTVLITGTGTIGSMAVECARHLGAAKIIVTSRNDDKLIRAKTLGADEVINSCRENIQARVLGCTEGKGVDRVIEMTGKNAIFHQALDALCPGGKLVCVGNHNQPLAIENFTGRVMYREIVITGIFGRRLFDTWDLAIQLVENGAVDLSKYVGMKLPLEQFEEGVKQFDKVFGRVVFLPEKKQHIQ